MSPSTNAVGELPVVLAPTLSFAIVLSAAAVSLPVIVPPDVCNAPVIRESFPAATVPAVVPVFLVAASPSPKLLRMPVCVVDCMNVSIGVETVMSGIGYGAM